jgi:peptide methionine sulfoxide reductase MsrA
MTPTNSTINSSIFAAFCFWAMDFIFSLIGVVRGFAGFTSTPSQSAV